MFIKVKDKAVSCNIKNIPWLTVVFCTGTVILYFVFGAAFPVLYSDYDQIKSGEYFRFITGHFIHCDNEHLFWNILAFSIIGMVIELESRWLVVLSLVAGIIGVDIWLLVSDDAPEIYCGLSGALNSMFIIAALILIQKTKSIAVIISVLLAIVKIALEMEFGSLITDISWQSVPAAHASGFAGGIVLYLGMVLFQRYSSGIWSNICSKSSHGLGFSCYH